MKTPEELKDIFIRRMLRALFDEDEDLEFIQLIEDARMFGFEDLAQEFISRLSEEERFIWQTHQSGINKEFSDN